MCTDRARGFDGVYHYPKTFSGKSDKMLVIGGYKGYNWLMLDSLGQGAL